MKILLLIAFLTSSAYVTPDSGPQGPAHGQAVEATFVRAASDLIGDPDPVQVRSASWGRVVPVTDAFPWTDRLVELRPEAIATPVTPIVVEADLSYDAADSDPVAARGW